MKRSRLVIVYIILLTGLFAFLARSGNLQLLNPQGIIAKQESSIIVMAIILAFFIGIPIIATTIFILFRYQEGNEKTYTPDWKASKWFIASWWTVPAIIVFFWAILGWQSVHAVDTFKPLISNTKPIEVQVVALQWKWLFIYPEQKIATVNYFEFPVNTPVNFQITADAPMNSFWIPSLGSQIYAMTGMVNQLHLSAYHTGDFPGQSAEMSGDGFSGMTFVAKSRTMNQFTQWVQSVRETANDLDPQTYKQLSLPSSYVPQTSYNNTSENLYNSIVEKYMNPTSNSL